MGISSTATIDLCIKTMEQWAASVPNQSELMSLADLYNAARLNTIMKFPKLKAELPAAITVKQLADGSYLPQVSADHLNAAFKKLLDIMRDVQPSRTSIA